MDTPGLNPDPSSYASQGAGGDKLSQLILEQLAKLGTLADQFTKAGLALEPHKGKVVPGVSRLTLAWLLPQPFGITPPQAVGLPEDYLRLPIGGVETNFTPKQIIEAITTAGPQRIFDMLQLERRRTELFRQLDQVTTDLQLKTRTDQELNDLLALTPDIGDPFGPLDIQRRAIINERNRRQTERNARERLGLVDPLTPGIESRGENVPDPFAVNWPPAGGIADALSIFGFIDALVAALPPDP